MMHGAVWGALLMALPGCTDSSWSTVPIEPSCNASGPFATPEPGQLEVAETVEGCFLGCAVSGDWAVGAEGEVTFRAPLGTGEPLSVSSSDDTLLAVEELSHESDECLATVQVRLAVLAAGDPYIVLSRGGAVVDRFPVAAREPAAVVVAPAAPSWSRPTPELLCTESEPRLDVQAAVHDASGGHLEHVGSRMTWEIDGVPVETEESPLERSGWSSPPPSFPLGVHRLTVRWEHLSTPLDVHVSPEGALSAPGFVCELPVPSE
jgi:hypothetical protein